MIIGLLGFIGSGKGTAGEILENCGCERESFAGALKDVSSVMFGWPRNLLEGDTQESRAFREQPDAFWSKKFGRDFTPREALQKMGTEVGRDVFHANLWVDLLEKKMDPNKHYVITDVRFKNEIDWIKNHGGKLIEIKRGIKPHWYDIACAAYRGDYKAEKFMIEDSDMHQSEWRWVGCETDAVVRNEGTVDSLKLALNECLTKFRMSDTMAAIDVLHHGVNK